MAELKPYLAVADARAAIEWYAAHLGAEVSVEPVVMPDGRVGHVELEVDGACWMMADEHPEIRVEGPDSQRGNAVTLHLDLGDGRDVDARASRMVDGGAVLDRGPEDTGVARVAVLRDPFGHRWFLNGAVRTGPRLRVRNRWFGVVLDADDGPALAHFYERLLGWTLFTESKEWSTLAPSKTAGYNMAFATEEHYVRPVWPT
ncbi:MAG: VOC family protein, partial [Nocardioidaceae bacterium]